MLWQFFYIKYKLIILSIEFLYYPRICSFISVCFFRTESRTEYKTEYDNKCETKYDTKCESQYETVYDEVCEQKSPPQEEGYGGRQADSYIDLFLLFIKSMCPG